MLILTDSLQEAFDQVGIPYPDRAPEPGKICRFPVNGRKHDVAGWATLFPDQEGAVFGSWRDGLTYTWQRKKDGPPPDNAERARLFLRSEEVRQAAKAEREADYLAAAKNAAQLWQEAVPASPGHTYLSAKRIEPYVARMNQQGALVIPVFDKDGSIQSLQMIGADPSSGRNKMFMAGGRMAEGRCWLGEPSDGAPIALVEGYATGASIHDATSLPVCVTFTAGNLLRVGTDIRAKFPKAKLLICGDDDRVTAGNPGREKAMEAAKQVNGLAVFPILKDGVGTDFNDMANQSGLHAVGNLIRNAVQPKRFRLSECTASNLFKGLPRPRKWLVHRIFPLGVSALLASPPNVGKSFLALEMAAKVAASPLGNLPAKAFGSTIATHGNVVYVSAEDDYQEIHRRLHSICNGVMPERLHVLSLPDVGHFGIIESNPARDFQATQSWLDLVEEIKELDELKLVVLDTLQALTSGDTNTTMATQPLMNEAVALASATGACVLLIHHVAKGTAKLITGAFDAMEAIRGSGAISGSARCAYVLWPPSSEEARKVCDTLGEKYKEGCVAFGIVAKASGDAMRDRSTFFRNSSGLLCDRTMEYRALMGNDDVAMRSELVSIIRTEWLEGHPFAVSQGGNGLHARNLEMPKAFHGKSRKWFEFQVSKLLDDKSIKSVRGQGGNNLAPIDCDDTTSVSNMPWENDGE